MAKAAVEAIKTPRRTPNTIKGRFERDVELPEFSDTLKANSIHHYNRWNLRKFVLKPFQCSLTELSAHLWKFPKNSHKNEVSFTEN